MSDLYEARQKTEEGANWRGTIDVTIDGQTHELTVRQLRDTEFWDVMDSVDTDEIDALQSDLPDDIVDEFEELQNKDDLDEDEQDRLEELQAEAEEDIDLFEELSIETFEGIKQAAKYGVEPDEQDVRAALAQDTDAIDEYANGTANEDARKYLNDKVITPMIEDSTDFTSFAIGVKVLGETLGDTGNFEN